jgi:hypothetical protein
MTTKEIVALAKACRKAGIKSFKNNEIAFELHEFSITNHVKRRSKKALVPLNSVEEIESDGWDNLPFEQKLYWSSDSLASEADETTRVEVK